MTANVTTAFWSVTINNPSEAQLALVRNGYPDYCREIVYTLEEGEEKGTPHIQAFVKLQRQQRFTFIKKLFPGGHYKPLTSAEYVHNTKLYAQKDDETTRSAHVHSFNDPTGTVEALIPQVIQRMWDDYPDDDRDEARHYAEQDMVLSNYRLAKVFVSAVYKQMWKQFGGEMMRALALEKERAHTHTHTHEELISVVEDIPTIEEDGSSHSAPEGGSSGSSQSGEDEDYEDSYGSEDEGLDSGRSSVSSEEDAWS